METQIEKKSPNPAFIAAIALLVAVGLAAFLRNRSGAKPSHDAWMTDFPAAQARAAAENKLILMDFTGSDWCPPCKALFKNVFAQPEFMAYASTQLVLVEVDFPQGKDKEQSLAVKIANTNLLRRFKVEGYPTVLLVDRTGKELKRQEGYDGLPAREFVEDLRGFKP